MMIMSIMAISILGLMSLICSMSKNYREMLNECYGCNNLYEYEERRCGNL